MAGTTTLSSSLTLPTYLTEATFSVVSTAPFAGFASTPFHGFAVVISGGGLKATFVIYSITAPSTMKGFFVNATGDAGQGTLPIGSTVALYAWQKRPVGNIPAPSTRTLTTSFDKLAIREEFSFAAPVFDGSNIYTLGGMVWVKTARSTYALPAALRAFDGDRASNTGAVKFWSGERIFVPNVKLRCERTAPAFVHQEQDMVNW